MRNILRNQIDLKFLEPEVNHGYLRQQIPVPRDEEIASLLSHVVHEGRLARLAGDLSAGQVIVLRVFAERMAASAVRNNDPVLLRLGLISLLLSWRLPDCRETLVVFPLFLDAVRRMDIDMGSFVASVREAVGDLLIAPFVEFLQRSEENKSLKAMGYTAGADADGFRYIRSW
ncbi:MAG: hypothetical protein ACREVO_10455 [Steroidobacteraceae bacterium]